MDFITNIQLYDTRVETPLLKASPSLNEKTGDKVYEKFDKSLEKAMNTLKDVNTQAEIEMEEYISGKTVDPAELMITMEKASMATNLAIQIRNRVIEGYKEINSVQI